MNNGVENNQNNLSNVPVMIQTGDVAPSTVPISNIPSNGVVAPSVLPATNAVPSYPSAPTMEIVPQSVAPSVPVMMPQTNLETAPVSTPIVVPPSESVVKEAPKSDEKPPKQKMNKLMLFLFLLVLILGGLSFFLYSSKKRSLSELKYRCSPIHESKEEVALDLDSTLVQDLYSKVKTSIREDYAQPEWNDTMKLYLAYRQISSHEMYDSNCNMFDKEKMEPYTCEMSVTFMPRAFSTSTLELEWKKLYGEETPMPHINVKLQNGCVGGFEYISERDEYVEGYCKNPVATSFKVKKTLKSAYSSRNMIILEEEVKYSGNEKMELPSYLKSGTYYYTFRLDMNYHYVLVSKKLDDKYS